MRRNLYRLLQTARHWLKIAFAPIGGGIAVLLMRGIRLGDRVRVANSAGRFMRRLGPWLPEHKTGRANLMAAFPEKSPEEIEQILSGVWDNVGRVAAEFSFLDRIRVQLPGDSGPVDASYDEITLKHVEAICSAPQATAFFGAHLANWELPALAAARFGVGAAVLFRAPSMRAIADAILKIRARSMGTLIPSGFDAPLRLAGSLERGTHVGMLVDQHEYRGVEVTFFGRPCKANPLIAQLARHTGCNIRGVRVVRLPDGNHFWGEFTEPLVLPRDKDGEVDIQQTMQAITTVIEGWVREHPEQWLWLHRRWRT
jgi:KDO2-lipid IV(A) lauroyltransferase